MRIRHAVPVLAIATPLAMLAPQVARAHTIYVGTCNPNANSVSTITQAISAVAPNGTIDICPGTYAEQLTITKSLKLVGVNPGPSNSSQVLIVPPAGGLLNNATDIDTNQPTAAQIAVQGATVSISGLTVDGTGNGIGTYGCAWDVVGIIYQNASGTVSGNVVRNEFAAPFASYGGCQSGLGIFVQTTTGSSNVVITKNAVETYAKNGITGNDAGTNVTISDNTVLGMGPTTGAGENSVQIGFGATGSVAGNIVGDDVWALDVFGDTGDAAAGILVYDSAGVPITGNTVNSTQYAIAVVSDGGGSADHATISTNKVGVTYLYDAIDVCGAGSATISGNTLNATDEAAIHLDSSCGAASTGNTVNNNKIDGACAGILEGTGSGGPPGNNSVLNAANILLTGSDVCPVAESAKVHGGKHKAHFRPMR
jgi:parallel beta-helix repeat protein